MWRGLFVRENGVSRRRRVLGVISNNSANDGPSNQSADKLVIVAVMVVVTGVPRGRRWTVPYMPIAFVMYWTWLGSMVYLVGRCLMSLAMANTMRGCSAVAGRIVVVTS